MSVENKTAIKVTHLYKSFKLPHEKNTSVKSLIINPFKKRSFEKQEVLKDVSFDIKSGEFFGIVGRNGSGKSTLLKLLAGIYSPDKGAIDINGKLTPFIELGVGFNPELTGRENVFLNGALLGFSRKEMLAMYDEIVEFAEIEKFMDQKLKNYSSGMQVRLAFSIAIRAKSDILLIDEVLAVGDSAFQRKCYEVFNELRKNKRTIVFVTHDMSAVERFCDKVAVVDKGKLLGVYKPKDASLRYDQLNINEETNKQKTNVDFKKRKRWGSGEVTVDSVVFNNLKTQKKPVIEMGKPATITIHLKNTKKIDYVVGLRIDDIFGVNISGPNSIGQKNIAYDKATFSIDKLPLLPGEYKLSVVIFDKDVVNEYDHIEEHVSFMVTADQHNLYGKVNMFGEWV